MFRDDAEIQAVFQMEVGREMNDHSQLYNKSFPNQHPIQSITGLEDALSGIDTKEGSLSDLTTDSKTNLVFAINEVDSHADTNATNLSNHIADKTNPHDVTKAQIGLGNVDNTSDLDKPISTATQSALNGKQDNLTTAQLAAVNSGIDSEKVGQISTNTNDITAIEDKIPAQASSSNQLADKNFVNSSISTATATFIGTFNSVAELEAYSGTVKNGDYAFVVSVDGQGNTVYNRYKYTTATTPASWQFEYALNNSSFTAEQWAAINSGATTTNIGQIATNTSNITSLDTNKADKSTTYTKTEVDTALSGKANVATTLSGYGITDGANTSLSNLNSDGQMVVDSVNGTISNCILEIPQNIKLEISGNTVTLKSGSTVVITGDTYRTFTTTNDISGTFNSDGKYYLMMIAGNSSIANWFNFNDTGSGSTLPADGSTYKRFFLTTDKKIYLWNNQNSSWAVWNNDACYPLGIIVVSNGVVSFAKDSNGNDIIFNGVGFIGHHAFVYPNVKGLIANGFNVDGTLKSTNTTLNSLRIPSLTASRTNATVCLGLNTINAHRVYTIVDDVSEITTGDYNIWYVRNENQMYLVQNSQNNVLNETVLITYSTDSNNNVTDFIIQQPVRMATVEMLDNVQSQVNTKQADITTITGYDATKTQTLKNVSGVLTWVDDGE